MRTLLLLLTALTPTLALAAEPSTLRTVRIRVAKPLAGAEVASLPLDVIEGLRQTTVDLLEEHTGSEVTAMGPNVLGELVRPRFVEGLPQTTLKRAARKTGHARFIVVDARFEYGGSQGAEQIQKGLLKGATRGGWLKTRVWVRVTTTDAAGQELSSLDVTVDDLPEADDAGDWARIDREFLPREQLQTFYEAALRQALRHE